MTRGFVLGLMLAAAPFAGATAAKAPPLPYHSLTHEFAEFFDKTAAMPEDKRVARFRDRFGTLFPGFYAPMDGQTDAQFNASVAKALAAFPQLRARYEATERDFPAAYAAGIVHFQAQFPGFQQTMPVWFVHSLGRMDGGTRTIAGRANLIFGADVIAEIHDGGDIGPFLDHEMFHVENARYFTDCEPSPVWCGLWQEGLATYAASVMNPGADDHQLLLDRPKPIRKRVDIDWRNALCQVGREIVSTDKTVNARYFQGQNDPARTYPARWGYYIGFRIMQRLGKRYTLRQLDRMGRAAAGPVLARELNTMIAEAGGCANVRA